MMPKLLGSESALWVHGKMRGLWPRGTQMTAHTRCSTVPQVHPQPWCCQPHPYKTSTSGNHRASRSRLQASLETQQQFLRLSGMRADQRSQCTRFSCCCCFFLVFFLRSSTANNKAVLMALGCVRSRLMNGSASTELSLFSPELGMTCCMKAAHDGLGTISMEQPASHRQSSFVALIMYRDASSGDKRQAFDGYSLQSRCVRFFVCPDGYVYKSANNTCTYGFLDPWYWYASHGVNSVMIIKSVDAEVCIVKSKLHESLNWCTVRIWWVQETEIFVPDCFSVALWKLQSYATD